MKGSDMDYMAHLEQLGVNAYESWLKAPRIASYNYEGWTVSIEAVDNATAFKVTVLNDSITYVLEFGRSGLYFPHRDLRYDAIPYLAITHALRYIVDPTADLSSNPDIRAAAVREAARFFRNLVHFIKATPYE